MVVVEVGSVKKSDEKREREREMLQMRLSLNGVGGRGWTWLDMARDVWERWGGLGVDSRC